MDIARLRRRGWSQEEIAHLLGTLERAQAGKRPQLRRLERMGFWLVIVALAVGTLALALGMLPLILLASAWVTVPIALVMGACLGMLLVHVLHDLKLEKSRQHTGVAVLLSCAAIAVALIVGEVSSRLVGPGTGAGASLQVAAALCAGILMPYLAHHAGGSHGAA